MKYRRQIWDYVAEGYEDLGESDVASFSSKIREENQKLLPAKKRRGWHPVLYVGARLKDHAWP
jgi:hypothetical protein